MKSWIGFLIAAFISLAVLILLDIIREIKKRK